MNIPANDANHHPVSMDLFRGLNEIEDPAEQARAAGEAMAFAMGVLAHAAGMEATTTTTLRVLRALTPGGTA